MRPRRRRILGASALVLLVGILTAWLVRTEKRPADRSDDTVDTSSSHGVPTESRRHVENNTAITRAEAAQPQESVVDSRLVVHVTDEQGAPVSSAVVEWTTREPAASIRLDALAEPGFYRPPTSPALPAFVRVSCEGFAHEERWVNALPSDELVVRLTRAAVIRGSVVRRATKQPAADVRVLAWPASLTTPPLDLLERALRDNDPRAVLTRTEADGTFELRHLVPSLAYRLVAAGHGLATEQPVDARPSDNVHVVLGAGQLYGTRIRITTPNEGARSFLAMVSSPTLMPIQPKLAEARYLPQPNFITTLAGLTNELTVGDFTQSTYLFVSDLDRAVLGSSPYRFAITGFTPVEADVQFPRVENELPERTFELRPLVETLQVCTVNLLWPPEIARRDVELNYSPGRIVLRPAGTRELGDLILFRLPSATCPRFDVGVPYGEYSVRYENRATMVLEPPVDRETQPLRVPSATSQVTIDLRNTGGIAVSTRNARGELISGSLELQVLRGDPTRDRGSIPTSYVFFAEPPYLIAPLEPGEYTLRVAGHSSAATASELEFAKVTAGAWTDVNVQLSAP